MDKNEKAPIVVKRIIKGGGHHGGAWKVAYADFVTAMMAFFLLMWLMGSTTKEQKAAISEFFNNPSAEIGMSTIPKEGGSEGPGGASTSPIDLGGGFEMPTQSKPDQEMDEATAEALAKEAEAKRMKELQEKLKEVIENTPALAPFKDQLLIDMTDEGLRIQIVDKENRPMFDLGSARLLPHAEAILRELAKTINQVDNRVSITGHTDARPYVNPRYTNWELSADRANAARRELTNAGLAADKIGKVVGLASSALFAPEDPSAPINRRIAIIVMTKQAAENLDAKPLPATNGTPSPKGAPGARSPAAKPGAVPPAPAAGAKPGEALASKPGNSIQPPAATVKPGTPALPVAPAKPEAPGKPSAPARPG